MARLFVFHAPGSVTFRLAVGYGALMLLSMAVLALTLYLGTVGMLNHGIDRKLTSLSLHLSQRASGDGRDALRQEIQRLLDDGIDSDTEVYQLVAPDGLALAGNLQDLPDALPTDQLTDLDVIRAGRASHSRLLAHRLADGGILVVGRDLDDLLRIETLVLRSLGIGSLVAGLLALSGALLFRRMIEKRLAAIRRTTAKIGAGDMNWRVPMGKNDDEFSRLSHDINIMLDRIQTLMDGVRDVSNAIAHDMRTPLARIRAKLDQAIKGERDAEILAQAAAEAIAEIDDLVGVFHKLLQIAEVESGGRRQGLAAVPLGELVNDMAELYDALAEERGITLTSRVVGTPIARGDRDLLAIALVNLLDNAVKYAGDGATITLSAEERPDRLVLCVRDNGPGIPAEQRPGVLKRFVRLDASRHLPGNGLGLSMVAAIAGIHDGILELDDAEPGLIVRITLPLLAR